MPLFVFNCAQRLRGCCPALASSAGHGPHQACKWILIQVEKLLRGTSDERLKAQRLDIPPS